MNRLELNKIMTTLRKYPKEYRKIKTRCKDRFISNEVNKKLAGKGFKSYEQIKEACPVGMKLSHFILKLIK